MPTDRIPVSPPPRALHYVTVASAAPVCGRKSRRLHITVNRSIVTCPRCLAALRETPRV